MKENKSTYLYILIFAIVLLLIIIGALVFTKKEEKKENKKQTNNTEIKKESDSGTYINYINNLNAITYNYKNVIINIDKEHKVVTIDDKVVTELLEDEKVSAVYNIRDWLLLVKEKDTYIIGIYSLKNKEYTEMRNIDYDNMGIYYYALNDNTINLKVKRYIDDNILLLEDDKKVDYCSERELNNSGINELEIVEGEYKILFNADEIEFGDRLEKTKTLKDIKSNC